MVYAAIDIHKSVFQAVVLESETGDIAEQRFAATREELRRWALPLRGSVSAVAIEATTGWRWVAQELSALGLDVRLADPAETRARRGKSGRAKTDRLDARWLVLLLAKELLPQAWLAPPEIQRLRDRTRLRKRLSEDRSRWAQRLHAFLAHEGWGPAGARACSAARVAAGRPRSSSPSPPACRSRACSGSSSCSRASSSRSRASCAASQPQTRARAPCSRSSASARSSPATCWPSSARPAASGVRARPCAQPGSTPSSTSPASAGAVAGWPSTARPSCAGRSWRPPRPPPAARPAPSAPSTSASSAAATPNGPP
jgi:Transposase